VPGDAQQTTGQYARGAGTWPNFGIYKPTEVAAVDLADSPRAGRLIREGKLHLSLSDAVALALENNLDIAVARYGPQEADAEILRTRGGGVTQGVNTAVGAASTGQSAAGPGGGNQVTGLSGTAFPAAGAAGGGGGGAVSNLDPVFTSSIGWNHFTNPQSSDFVAGTSSVVFDSNRQQMGYAQGFLTGTSFQLNFTNTGSENNIDRNNFNPSLNSSASLTVTQRLTQGFGRGLNSINISVAKNNREISDLAFEDQVMTTVNSVVGLYWDLVGFSAQVAARRVDLELSEKLLRDNKRKVELGLLAGIEVMRSEAQVASSRNQLTQAIRTFREQEVVLKNALSKNGPSGAAFSGVEVAPTDRIVIPEIEPIEPLQDLVAQALQARPNLVQSRINLTNSDLRVKGVRNAMLPSLDLVGTATNNALAGTVNPDLANIPGVGQPNPFFVGGFGTALGQIFRRNFPDYGVRLQLSIPLKNRQAQASMTRQLIARRRQDLQLRQQENDVKLQVEQALVRLQQARAAYEQARDSRALQEKLLNAEERSFALGNSNNFQIVQVQQNLATSRVNEITSMTAYIKARADLDFSTGRTLEANNVSIEEAFSGSVTKNPDPLPPNG
jgi:outer membrane protein TolC